MNLITEFYHGIEPVSTIIGAVILSLIFLRGLGFILYYLTRHLLIVWTICRCIYLVEKVHGAEKGMVT